MATPVQWVVSPGGSLWGSARTHSATAGGSAQPATGASCRATARRHLVHEPLLPAPQAGLALAGAPYDLVGAQTSGGQQHDPRSPHVLLRAVSGRHDPLKPSTIGGIHIDDDPYAHPADSHAGEPMGILRRTLPSDLFH